MLDQSRGVYCCRDRFTLERTQIGLAPDRPTALSVSGLGRDVLACFEQSLGAALWMTPLRSSAVRCGGERALRSKDTGWACEALETVSTALSPVWWQSVRRRNEALA